MSETERLPDLQKFRCSTTRISVKRNRGQIMQTKGLLAKTTKELEEDMARGADMSNLQIPLFFTRSQEKNNQWAINLETRPATSYSAVLAHSPRRGSPMRLDGIMENPNEFGNLRRSQTAPNPSTHRIAGKARQSTHAGQNARELTPEPPSMPKPTPAKPKPPPTQTSPPSKKQLKLPELGKSPQLVRLERSNRKVHGRLVELRSDHRVMREFQHKVHEEETLAKRESTARLRSRNVVTEYAETIFTKLNPEILSANIRSRHEEHNHKVEEVQERKKHLDEHRIIHIKSVIEDKWKRREEAKEAARQAELAAQHAQRMKVMLTTIALNARLFTISDQILRKRAVDRAYHRLFWSVKVIQRYFRNVYLRRREEERLHAVLRIQQQMRWYLHDMRGPRLIKATTILREHLQDLQGASQVKELLATFMMRARRIQSTMHNIHLKLKHRRAVYLAQWECWEKERMEEQDKLDRKVQRASQQQGVGLKPESSQGKVKAPGKGAPAKGSKPLARSSSTKELEADDSKGKKGKAAGGKGGAGGEKGAKKTKERFQTIPYAVKHQVVMVKMQEARLKFITLHREWKQDLSVFMYDWEENKFTYQTEMLKGTSAPTPEEIEALKVSMTPVEPKWSITATTEQIEEMHQAGLEALKTYVPPKEGEQDSTFLTQGALSMRSKTGSQHTSAKPTPRNKGEPSPERQQLQQ